VQGGEVAGWLAGWEMHDVTQH